VNNRWINHVQRGVQRHGLYSWYLYGGYWTKPDWEFIMKPLLSWVIEFNLILRHIQG
jgi:hypothetical protein